MAAPVGNQQPILPAQGTGPIQNRAPAGMGAAPTTMQAGQQSQERGYIESLVIAIKDLILMIFAKIFSCFKKAEAAPTPPAQPAQPQGPDLRAQHQEILNRLRRAPRSEELLRYFDAYFPSEGEKMAIYLRLGQAVPPTMWSNLWSESYNRNQKIQMGRNMVEREPTLIIPHLIQKIEIRVNP